MLYARGQCRTLAHAPSLAPPARRAGWLLKSSSSLKEEVLTSRAWPPASHALASQDLLAHPFLRPPARRAGWLLKSSSSLKEEVLTSRPRPLATHATARTLLLKHPILA